MRFRFNVKYLCAFIVVLIIEVLIGVFVHDDFIRPYIGDVLVVVVMYCFIKTFIESKTRLLPLYLFIFALLVEVGQYFELARLLGLSDYRIARVIIGSTFDLKDIACYFVGCAGLFAFEIVTRAARRD